MRPSSERPRRKGAALILFTLMVPAVLIPMIGLAIDGTMLYMVKAKLSSAVDGGAIAAAQSLSAGLTLAAQQTAAVKTADQFVRANLPNGYWGSYNLTYDPPITVAEDTSTSLKRRTVEITAHVQVPLLFMRILGHDWSTVSAYSKTARRDVRMVLVLDRSGSMTGAINDLKAAAIDFVNKFAEKRDQVGLVVFGGSAIVAFPPRDPDNPGGGTGPADNFKTANPSIPQLIAAINPGSSTGMSEGLWLAYQELLKNPQPGALNLIILFTDGLPNGITAYFNDPANSLIQAGSPCTYKIAISSNTQMTGWITQGSGFALAGTVSGIFRLMNRTQDAAHPTVMSWMSSPTEDVLPAPASQTCTYAANRNRVSADLRAIPSVDSYGNRTDGTGYLQSIHYLRYGVPQDLTTVNSPYQIGLASWNATDDAARRIRADNTLNPVIYTIGYAGGSEPPDQRLMKRIANANDPQNSAYDLSRPAGLYVMAPTSEQLSAAFARVASEILRLTN